IYEDDILLVKTGSTYGKIALVKNLKEDATLNPQVVVFKRLKSPAAFLAYIMQSDIVQNQIEETIVGGAIPTLSQKVVLSYKIPLPAPREQLAIANVLSDTDALIIAIEQLIVKKKAIKTAFIQQLLTGRTRLPQYSKHPDGTIKSYKHTELGLIPVDWIISTIDECANKVGSGKTPTGGSSVYTEAGHPFVRSQNIGWG
ncbi:restriction endonuclease subunit S, partial [Salmonella enterica]|nr:restriction endonuclease subunit S [Salmonella enterica]